jgi:hypothetical protein
VGDWLAEGLVDGVEEATALGGGVMPAADALGAGVPGKLGLGVTETPQAASPAATDPAAIARRSARREIALSCVTEERYAGSGRCAADPQIPPLNVSQAAGSPFW